MDDLLGVSSFPGSPAISLSDDGKTMIAGAPGATMDGNADQGAAYVFLPEPSFASGLGATIAMLIVLARRRQSRF